MATLVNSTYTAGSGTASISPTIGTHQSGDRIVVVLHGKYNTTTIPSSANGFTRIGSAGGGTGSAGNDSGTVFGATYVRDATGSAHTLTLTAGATAPNTWGAWAFVFRLDAGETFTDAVASMTQVFVSDTNTASALTGTTSTPGNALDAADIFLAVGAIPTDAGTALTAGATITNTGLSGGTVTNATTQYGEASLGQDCAAVWAMWDGFTGTSSGGFVCSFTITGASDHSGLIIGVPLRVTPGNTDYTKTPADDVDVTDSATRIMDAVRSQDDSAGVTDTTSLIRGMAQADPVGVTDSATRVMDAVRTPADPVGVTDSASRVMDVVRSQSDPVGVTDATTLDRGKAQADSVGVTDAVQAILEQIHAKADSIGVTDSVARVMDAVRSHADSLGLTDVVARVMDATRSASDAVGLTDSVSYVLHMVRTVGDNVGVTDAASSQGNQVAGAWEVWPLPPAWAARAEAPVWDAWSEPPVWEVL